MKVPTCAIVVLNYNGRTLLRRFLESVIVAASRATLCDIQVILLDNTSTDDSLVWVQDNLCAVKALPAPTNRYLYSYNWAAGILEHELLLLLNNDIEMQPECLDPLFETLLSNPRAFSVTPRVYHMDRTTPSSGRWVGQFIRGLLTPTLANTPEGVMSTLFPCGGAMLVRRNDFIALGGFDELYYPAYWEDVDLGYRAWKRGQINLYQPSSIMYHVESASMSLDPAYTEQKNAKIFRNVWLFTWRNVSDARVLGSNLYWTARHYVALRRRGEKILTASYHHAFPYMQTALAARRRDDRWRTLSDSAILKHAGSLAE